MVVRINVGSKPAGAVLYNEYKVANGEARFIGGYNSTTFEREAITVNQKINVLERYVATNTRIGKPTFHASLAFHPSEQLSDDQLKLIGQQYMERLGYGEQPYLMYRHEDTHHPHIHIVSVSVDFQGKKISDSHQKRRSNAIRQSLEKEYSLMEAEKQGKEVLISGLLPEQILNYEEPEAKKAIGNVVRTALTDYNFSNVQTFSEFLHQHRVQLNQLSGVAADGKAYQGITFQLHNGQNDQRGEAIGPAIKASRFAFAPTFERLETKFKQNATRIRTGTEATRQRIHSCLKSYTKLSEKDFKTQLRSAGIQVIDTGKQYVYVDHKSRNVYDETELGTPYTRSVQKAAFSDQSVSEESRQRRVQSSTSTPQQPPTSEELILRRRVSHFYQQLRQQGVDGKQPYFFESQLIRQFPHEPLTKLIIGEGIHPQAARLAVTEFETYKQGQLPDIRSKEEAYFSQTTRQFASLTAELPLSSTSKRAFLSAADFVLTVDQSTLVHREDAQLRYSLPASIKKQLQQDGGPSVAFQSRLSKAERMLYGALASGQMPPDSISFYQVSAAHLKAATGPLFERVSLPLNQAYANQVSQRLSDDKPLMAQLQARGILIDALASGTYRMGHYLTRSDEFIPVTEDLTRRLQNESIPTLTEQTESLKTRTGRSLVTISQALDMNNTTLMQAELNRWQRETSRSPGTGSLVEQAKKLQSQLQKQVDHAKGIQPALKPTKETGVEPKPVITQPVSTLGQDLVRLLQQSNLTAQQRYHLAVQLGLVWQRTASGIVGLKEGESLPHPGRVYTLKATEQPYFVRPDDKEPINLRLNGADRTLLHSISQGNDLTGLNQQQIARLTLPALEKILPEQILPTFQRAYNELRGNQILSDAYRLYDEQTSVGRGDARNYLSTLYQRGFLVKQEVDAFQKPVYRMGYYTSESTSYVAVPPEIGRAFTRQFPIQASKNTYVLEGAWPAPNSISAQRMRSLARAIDGNVEPKRINTLLENIHQRFPHLSSVHQPQQLLNHLVSQPRLTQQQVRSPLSSTQPGLTSTEKFSLSNNSTRSTESSRDSLQSLLERFENQAPQKGLLDILGESASAVRPRKKRIGEDVPHRRKRYKP